MQANSSNEQSKALIEPIDWSQWQPDQHATLLLVIKNNKILLIEKKRGLGAGKFNGPGGKLDPGETPLAAAIREVEEELLITPLEVSFTGEVWFQSIGEFCGLFELSP